jgi:hypothetical protein
MISKYFSLLSSVREFCKQNGLGQKLILAHPKEESAAVKELL